MVGHQMNEIRQQSADSDDEAVITLGLLNAVEENSALTQRSVASELGIALGLTNAYLKRCVRKGLIKVSMAPANRYAYYLTPKGFAEKSRLTARYLSISFNFFRAAREQCAATFSECADQGWRRVLLAGAGDMSEIATLCADDLGLELVGILDPDADVDEIAGLAVFARLEDAGQYDAVVITDLREPQKTFNRLIKAVPSERVLAPRMLNVSRTRPKLAR
jgi:DNA-binding MarR family transcriptional regulator